jgi:subtilisin family serine protease
MIKNFIVGLAATMLIAGGSALAAPATDHQKLVDEDGSVSADYKGNSGSGGGSSATVSSAPVAPYQAGMSSTWFNQIGLNSAIETEAKGGAGITIGMVDTGLVASNPEISGRVSTASSCAAATFSCSNGYTDDNGHGTATASIAAGSYNNNDLMSGVAPSATVLSEKVLNASGVGYDTDVANGIIRAANGGAQVINLSLTYAATSTIVSAINYAASKGAVIVWAGGNSGAVFDASNTTGLTTAALSHLMFVGSVNAGNTVSSFSNRPGTAKAVAGNTSTSYASLWLMAPGENIVAPAIEFGSTANAYWTGTSMSAPEVAGAVALLEATWPVLQRNGTTSALLFASATDLGAKGVDSTYGNGLLNLTKAFQPVGALSVFTASGQSIPVGGAGTLTSGPLGALSSVQRVLSKYTTFDTFQRNFTANLSGRIHSQSSLANVMAGAAAAPVSVTQMPLPGGGRLMLAASDTSLYDEGADNASALVGRTTAPRDPGAFMMSLTNRNGSTVSVGRGLPSTAAFANAMWGEDTIPAYQANELGVSNALMGFTQGGYFASIGTNLGSRARLGVTWSQTPQQPLWAVTTGSAPVQSASAAVGLTLKLTPHWTAGFTASSLDESNTLLGSSYNPNGLLSLGAKHHSASIGVTSAYDLGGDRGLLFDAVFARIGGGSTSSGLIASTSTMTARAFGVSFVQSDALREGDHITLSIRKPLKVISGTAELAVTNVDDQGYPTTSLVKTSLRPDGDETDVSLGYGAALSHRVNFTAGLTYRSDAYNVRGVDDVNARLSFSVRF